VYTILQVSEQGWGSTRTLVLGAISIALVAAFVARQARIANPLMPLRLFHSRNVAGANVVIALLVVGMFGMFFLGALYLQRILGYSPLEVGLAFLPSTVVMGTMSLKLSGPLAMRYGPKAILLVSLVSIGVGVLLFALTPVDGTYATQVMPATIFIGIGAGLGFPSLMGLAMSGATPSDSGLASGLINTSVQVGGAIGLAVLATLASERTDVLRASGQSADAALNGGFHLAYLIGAALVGVAIVVALSVLRSGTPAAAGQQGEPHAEPRRATPAYSDAC
jgi:MFS family permease